MLIHSSRDMSTRNFTLHYNKYKIERGRLKWRWTSRYFWSRKGQKDLIPDAKLCSCKISWNFVISKIMNFLNTSVPYIKHSVFSSYLIPALFDLWWRACQTFKMKDRICNVGSDGLTFKLPIQSQCSLGRTKWITMESLGQKRPASGSNNNTQYIFHYTSCFTCTCPH